jgi:hypothetical protein
VIDAPSSLSNGRGDASVAITALVMGENRPNRILELLMLIDSLSCLQLIVERAACQSGERKQVCKWVLLP